MIIYPDRNVFAPSGDFILHENPRLKAGLFFHLPQNSGFAGGLFDDVLISFEYQANFPNDKIRSDVFRYSDSTSALSQTRPVWQNTNMKIAKGFSLLEGTIRASVFMEVSNLFNGKWVNFAAVEGATPADQKAFIDSDFEILPEKDANGVPLVETAKFLNLPRSILFGLTLEL